MFNLERLATGLVMTFIAGVLTFGGFSPSSAAEITTGHDELNIAQPMQVMPQYWVPEKAVA